MIHGIIGIKKRKGVKSHKKCDIYTGTGTSVTDVWFVPGLNHLSVLMIYNV